MRLRPDETVTPEDLARGERALVKDAAWATTAGALYGGVILVGFALELGAPPVIIGLLAAIPFLAQISQLAAIALIERVRQRRKIVLLAVTVARTLILSLALVAFAEGQLLQLSLLVVVQAAISLSGAIAGCAFNGWVHEVVPRETLGTLFSRRLFWSTVFEACQPVGILRKGVGQDFDRDLPTKVGVGGAPHVAYAAHADLGVDFIHAEAGARGQSHGKWLRL